MALPRRARRPQRRPRPNRIREVREEAGIDVEILAEDRFHHPAVTTIPTPFTIIEMPVNDKATGPHHHIDLVYLCRALTTELTHQPAEVAACTWIPIAEVATLATPPELPSLITEAAKRH